MAEKVRAIDLFCGAGGSSWGAKCAGVEIVAGFDMWETAGKVYKDNFPDAKFYGGKLENIRPEDLVSELGRIDLILASPECTNHSVAKGNKPRCEESRKTALQVLRFAEVFRPRWIIIENVSSMRNWERYEEFINDVRALGYHTRIELLNAADFGVAQSRKRLFILCDRKQKPESVMLPHRKRRTARDIIDGNGTYNYSPLYTKRRAKATLERAKRAIKEVGETSQFLIVYYGSDAAGGWQRLDVPLRTITTLDRFAFVKPDRKRYVMRMLQPPELKAAMGWSKKYKINHGTRRDKIKMIGNAVCSPIMKAIVTSLTKLR
ncbi:MAG: DNA (cytosine-5-)-methyltransferase [Planctomycetes bacterium RBG_13_44_8b]|nr:MAG: DNA (cytosine-5-)-methyltransferase [Planctomycetes bacterium RBG_13_44_8b]